MRPEKGLVAARVWEEARKALSAEAWTRAVAGYRYTLLRYRRTLDQYGRAALSETQDTARNVDAAFTSVPVDDIVNVGFVQPMPDATTKYYVPDAEVLLSDSFLDTHCLAASMDDQGRVGLVFRPIPGRLVPEVRGVLWLNGNRPNSTNCCSTI